MMTLLIETIPGDLVGAAGQDTFGKPPTLLIETIPDELPPMTLNELGEHMGVEYAVVSGLVKFLVQRRIAKVAGSRPTATGKGKPATLYVLPSSVTFNVKE